MADQQGLNNESDSPVLSIMIEKIRNLKGESHGLSTRIDLGERTVGESPKVETTEPGDVNIHYLFSLPLNNEDPLAIDELVSRPLLITVLDTSGAPQPKEKKATGGGGEGKGGKDKDRGTEDRSRLDDKGSAIGQCTIDLMPILLKGETDCNITATIHPLPGSSLETTTADQPQCEVTIDMNIRLSKSLLTPDQLSCDNFISVTVESLYSPPEELTTGAAGYTYVTAYPLPLTSERENVIANSGGVYKAGPPTEGAECRKKWAIPAGAVGLAACIDNEMVGGSCCVEETGDLREYDDRKHRKYSEEEGPRITWNSVRRSYLKSTALTCFKEKIAQSRYLPVEVFRMAAPTKRSKEDEPAPTLSFHGLAYVDLAPLLYPGVKRIRGAYRVIAYTDQEITCNAKRYSGVGTDAARLASAIVNHSVSLTSLAIPLGGHPPPPSASDSPTPPNKKDEKPAGKDKKGGAPVKEPEPVEAPLNPEGQMYADCKSYIIIEIVLDHPIVPSRSDEEKIQRVASIIPPRPLFPKRTNTAQKAVDDFHYHVGSIANMLVCEMRDYLGEGIHSLTDGSFDDRHAAWLMYRRQKLIYHLNTSGKYLAFKEQLKHAVVKIVREKFCRTSTFQDPNELQAFICELYVYLLDEMHIGLNRVLSVEDERPLPVSQVTSDQLKHFAREAEVNGNNDLAASYYRERIARERNDPNHWIDYGVFCMSINDLSKAEECFRECVSIDQSHIYGLMLCGVVFSMQGKAELCEAMFEAATAIEPCNKLLWTVFGLSYDCLGNNHRSEMALAEAVRISWTEAESDAVVAREQERLEREAAEAAAAAQAEAAAAMAAAAAAESGRNSPKSPDSKDKGRKSPKGSAKKEPPAKPPKKEAKGKKGKADKQKIEAPPPEPVPESPPPAVPSRTIYMEAAEFLLEVKAMPLAERALSCHLMDRFGGATRDYYIAMGRLMLQRGCMEEAECNLNQSIQLYYQSVEAWSLLGHKKYLTGDLEGAKSCYTAVLSFMIDSPHLHSIYLRLASIHLNNACYCEARDTFLLACKSSPSCVSWLGAGIASYRMGLIAEAEDALAEANILNNMDPEVWGYLTLISLTCGRRDEAEQAYKFCRKLNLQDEALLEEIHGLQREAGFGDPSFTDSSPPPVCCN